MDSYRYNIIGNRTHRAIQMEPSSGAFQMTWPTLYPLVMTNIAIENGYL